MSRQNGVNKLMYSCGLMRKGCDGSTAGIRNHQELLSNNHSTQSCTTYSIMNHNDLTHKEHDIKAPMR